MAIIHCRKCNREISSEAAVCPDCGIEIGSRGRIGAALLTVGVILAGWATLTLIDRSNRAVETTAASFAENAANDRILALSAVEQATALGKMVAERCAGTEAFFQGMVKGQSFWSVRCSNGEAYQIAINPDAAGSTRVLVCGNAAPLATECFKRF
jgi:hypothetical protein